MVQQCKLLPLWANRLKHWVWKYPSIPIPHAQKHFSVWTCHPAPWKFQYTSVILSFESFGFWNPPPPSQNFQWPSWCRIFLKPHVWQAYDFLVLLLLRRQDGCTQATIIMVVYQVMLLFSEIVGLFFSNVTAYVGPRKGASSKVWTDYSWETSEAHSSCTTVEHSRICFRYSDVSVRSIDKKTPKIQSVQYQ